jgi:hypothetical protein
MGKLRMYVQLSKVLPIIEKVGYIQALHLRVGDDKLVYRDVD